MSLHKEKRSDMCRVHLLYALFYIHEQSPFETNGQCKVLQEFTDVD